MRLVEIWCSISLQSAWHSYSESWLWIYDSALAQYCPALLSYEIWLYEFAARCQRMARYEIWLRDFTACTGFGFLGTIWRVTFHQFKVECDGQSHIFGKNWLLVKAGKFLIFVLTLKCSCNLLHSKLFPQSLLLGLPPGFCSNAWILVQGNFSAI